MTLERRRLEATALASRAHPADLALLANSPGEPIEAAKPRAHDFRIGLSVGAAIRPIVRRVIRVIRTIEAASVVAAAEPTSSRAKVIVVHVGHVICAKAADTVSTKTSNATAVKATHVTSAETTHMGSAETAHVAAAKATHVAAASASATAGLRTRSKKAASKHRTCQNYQHSSSHDILH